MHVRPSVVRHCRWDVTDSDVHKCSNNTQTAHHFLPIFSSHQRNIHLAPFFGLCNPSKLITFLFSTRFGLHQSVNQTVNTVIPASHPSKSSLLSFTTVIAVYSIPAHSKIQKRIGICTILLLRKLSATHISLFTYFYDKQRIKFFKHFWSADCPHW